MESIHCAVILGLDFFRRAALDALGDVGLSRIRQYNRGNSVKFSISFKSTICTKEGAVCKQKILRNPLIDLYTVSDELFIQGINQFECTSLALIFQAVAQETEYIYS